MPANPTPLNAPTAEDFRAWHRVQCAALAHDRPGEPVPSQAALTARLTTAGAGSRMVLWLVRGPGEEAVATATLRLFEDPGRSHLAEVDVTVHPAHRRLGTGSRLLSTLTEAAAGAGCRSMVAEVMAGTPGEGFLATREFVPVLRLTWQLLTLEEVPDRIRKLPDVAHHGYRLAFWEGEVPGHLADSFARAHASMADMPTGDMDTGELDWDPERVRQAARVVAARGERLLTVAALSEADHSVAGFTELVLPADRSPRAQQYGTAVLPVHRGHGLGLWVKSEMLRRVRDHFPSITHIQTDNADDNRHMLAVNTALGFRPLRRTVEYQLRLAEG
ncbi:GNAT family N-acetyltransferase [Actinacidiphila acididurans]|uniref:GNAT family N-acetyltransferase n=1 Tax=Actinacidiphila acididurans TaxID=2784346 RepID=A0ABS2TPZ5_9ACTN|nr:GNAT family N-acetyltransferase [Actinacidiphila acididurans]MBM9505409.1 GNAT family N-acetyltransferase [Actinacidiphila acididurans]